MQSKRKDGRLHALINETRMESVILSRFPCAECGLMITPDLSKNEVRLVPVRHGVQFGGCQSCGAAHFVVSASTKADCIALEPVFAEMKRAMTQANHFRPDQAGEFPFTTEVEILLGGIGRAIYPDGTLQFADQDCTPVAVYSPRLDEQALETFCEQHIERYRAHHEMHKESIQEYETPAIEPFWE